MTTTKKNRSKNKKMKLYKNIEGGNVGRLKINPTYLLDRIKYTYEHIFNKPELFTDKDMDNLMYPQGAPLFFLKTSTYGEDIAENEGYQDVVGSTISTKGDNATLANVKIGDIIPFKYFSQFYANYISGDFTRAVKASRTQEWLGRVNKALGRGKYSGGRSVTDANYDEFFEKTNLGARATILMIKQFDVFMDYINKVGSEYKKGILRYLKQNMDKAFPVGEDIDFNEEFEGGRMTGGVSMSSARQLAAEARAAATAAAKGGPVSKKKSTSYYGDIPPSDSAEYKAEIIKVNTRLYDSIRNQITDDPENPSLIIPSAFWFFGDIIKVTGDLDIRTTLPEALYTELLAVQHAFEKDVFNSRADSFTQYLFQKIRQLTEQFAQENRFLDDAYRAKYSDVIDPNAVQDTEILQKEYQRQKDEDETLHLVEKTFNPASMDPNTRIEMQTAKGIKYVVINTNDIEAEGSKSAYQVWLTIFVQSEEYPLFIKSLDIRGAEKDKFMKELEDEISGNIDLEELGKTKTFYNAEVFESEDPDSVNYDLIKQLREQEDSFNKVVADLKAPFEIAQAEQKRKNEEALNALKAKIGPTEAEMYKELDKAMETNKQNRIERKNEDVRVKLAEETMEEEDSALASLKNFKDCSSGPPRVIPPARVFQDVNIQDIIKKSGTQLLAGGKKRMSIAQQVYLLNKRYIGDYGDEGPNIKYNSARKKGGATDGVNRQTTNIDSRLGIQNATTNYIDYAQLEKEINDMDLAITILDLADNVVGMIPFVGDALSAGITIANMVMAEEIKKKEREMEEKRKENERLLDSFYVFKENMQNQMVLTLSTQADPKIYAKMKQVAIAAFINIDPNNAPTPREVKLYSRRLDDERNEVITTRKAITDKMTENSTDILDVVGNTLEEQDNEKSELIDEGFQARKAIVTEFVKKLKEYVKTFIDEQKELDKADIEAAKQADEVNKIVDKKQDELEDEAEDIAGLKGYSACKSNVKSQEQMKEDALNQLKEQEKKKEEDIAQGKIKVEGLGKRYKKNSIANQVYMLNARYINSF